jgi:hypothetical protein
MKIADRLAVRSMVLSAIWIFSLWCATAPQRASAQTVTGSQKLGDNAIWTNSTTITGSSAFIDASVFSGTDICAKIANALSSSSFPAGGVLDARAVLTGSLGTCASSPSDLLSSPPAATILLPAGVITLPDTWVLGNQMRIIGEGRGQTTITPSSTFSTSKGSALLQMGSSSCTTTSPCTGIVISELWVQGNTGETVPADGIDNPYAGAFSYVEHATVSYFTGNGLLIEGAVASSGSNTYLADGSGPYSDLIISNVSTGTSAATASTTCINLQAQTRGIHGLTCTANGSPTAGSYLDGSNNTIEDVHFEGVITGVLVGSQHVAAGNSVINVSGADGSGPVDYDIQVSSNTQTGGSPNVSDLTLEGISPYGFIKDFVVLDNLTGVSIPKADNVALYALGNSFGSGYSLFSTTPVTPSSSVPTNGLPTWGVGGTNLGSTTETCNTPGALYSNTAGGTGSTVFVCTEATQSGGQPTWQPIA